MAMTVWIVGAVEGGRRGDCLQDVCWIWIDGTSGWMIGSGEMEAAGGPRLAPGFLAVINGCMEMPLLTGEGVGWGG